VSTSGRYCERRGHRTALSAVTGDPVGTAALSEWIERNGGKPFNWTIARAGCQLTADPGCGGLACAMSRNIGVVTLLDRRLVTQALWQGEY